MIFNIKNINQNDRMKVKTMRECEMEVYRIPAVKSGSPLGEIRLEKIQRWISIYISSDSTSDFYIFNTSADHSRRTFVELKEEKNLI